MKKFIFIVMLSMLFLSPCSAELTIEPEIFDTYFLYSGMGINQTSKYIFHSSHDVVSCGMVPQNDLVSCRIYEGYIIEVWFSTIGESYIGELQATDNNGTTASSTIIIRTHDFGSYSGIPEIPIGSLSNISYINLFFSIEDENINGIRNWLMMWTVVLFLFAIVMSFRK